MPSNDKKRKIEPIYGVIGLIFLLEPEIRFGISLADWISRGQTVLTFRPYVAYLATPWAVGGGLLFGFTLLNWASRLERIREDDDAPKIILPYDMKYEKKKKKNVWLVRAFVSLSCTIGLLLLFGLFKRFQSHNEGSSMVAANNIGSDNAPYKQQELQKTPDKQQNVKPMTVKPTITAPNRQSDTNDLSQSTPQAQPAISLPADQKPRQQSQILSQPEQGNQITQSIPDGPAACPPPGTFSSAWMIADNSNSASPVRIVFTIEITNPSNSQMSPLLKQQISQQMGRTNSGFHRDLDSTQAEEAQALLEELNSRMPKPKAIPTSNGPIEFQLIPSAMRRYLRENTETVWFYSVQKTQSGTVVSNPNKSFPITSLSARDLKLISALDRESNTAADNVCKEALNQLVPHKP